MGPRNNTTKKSKEIHWKPPHKPTSAAEIIEIEPPKAKTETMSSGRPDPKAPCQGAIHSAKPETSSIPDVGCNPTPVVDNLRSNVAAPPGLPEGPEMHHEGKGESLDAAESPERTSNQSQQFSNDLRNLQQQFLEFREMSVKKDQAWEREVEALKEKLNKVEGLEKEVEELKQKLDESEERAEVFKQKLDESEKRAEVLQQRLEGVEKELKRARQELNQMHRSLCRRQIAIAIYKLLGCKDFESRKKFFDNFKDNRRVLKLRLEEVFSQPISKKFANEFFAALDLGDHGIIKQGNVTAHEYTFEQGEEHAEDSKVFKFYLSFMQEQRGYQKTDEIGKAADKGIPRTESGTDKKRGGSKQPRRGQGRGKFQRGN